MAGAGELIGSAIVRRLRDQGFSRVMGVAEEELDLTDAAQVEAVFSRIAPEYVFLTAGKAAGTGTQQRYPADLLRDNLLVECEVIHAVYRHRVKKLLYLASSCSYTKQCV